MTSPVQAARGQISPELVLVDPELRQFLAEADPLEPPRWAVEPRPSPTLLSEVEAVPVPAEPVANESIPAGVSRSPAAAERTPSLVLSFERPLPPPAPTPRRRPARRATLAVALVAGARTLGAGGAAAPSQRAVPSFAADASVTQPAIVSAGQPVERSFVWTPVSNAAGYRVEFFLGSERVFATRTSNAQLTLPAVWRDEDGRLRALTPGSYRWYVWALGPDGRAAGSGTAIVQARLEVDE
jgi:hypothetical protein